MWYWSISSPNELTSCVIPLILLRDTPFNSYLETKEPEVCGCTIPSTDLDAIVSVPLPTAL